MGGADVRPLAPRVDVQASTIPPSTLLDGSLSLPPGGFGGGGRSVFMAPTIDSFYDSFLSTLHRRSRNVQDCFLGRLKGWDRVSYDNLKNFFQLIVYSKYIIRITGQFEYRK